MIEHGYDPVTSQYLVVKVDGTYHNSMLFANTYTIQPIRGNFVSIPEQDVKIKGETQLDFKVQPYIRIRNLSIRQEAGKIVATFTIQQTVPQPVQSVMLYAHPESGVGINLNIAQTVLNIGSTVDPDRVFTLEMDLEANKGRFVYENQYFFRVGALIDVPEAKPNYAPAVRLPVNF